MKLKIKLISTIIVASAMYASAATVTFNTTNLDGTDFTTPYTEDGVTFTSTTGDVIWRDDNDTATEPSESIDISGADGGVTFGLVGGGAFAFTSLDVITAGIGNSDYTISATSAADGSTITALFTAATSPTVAELEQFNNVTDVTLLATSSGGLFGSDLRINELTTGAAVPVPEPSSALLLGLAGIGVTLRRRR